MARTVDAAHGVSVYSTIVWLRRGSFARWAQAAQAATADADGEQEAEGSSGGGGGGGGARGAQLSYALRVCIQHGHHRACVHLYCALRLWDEAVGLALHVDVALAKSVAHQVRFLCAWRALI